MTVKSENNEIQENIELNSDYPTSIKDLPSWGYKYNQNNLFEILKVMGYSSMNTRNFRIGHKFSDQLIALKKKGTWEEVMPGQEIQLNPSISHFISKFPYNCDFLRIVTGVPFLTIEVSKTPIHGSGSPLNNCYSFEQLKEGEIYSMYDVTISEQRPNTKLDKYFLVYKASLEEVELYFLEPIQVFKLYSK